MMTFTKDTSPFEITLCFWKVSKHDIFKTLRRCLYVLLAICICLAVITMSWIHIHTDTRSNFDTNVSSERKISEIAEPLSVTSACQIENCTIICLNLKKIYDEVFQVLQSVECKENIILKLDNQHFPNLILTNKWKSANKGIKTLVIKNSEFKHIRNEAFNSVDFTATQTVTLLNINLNTLGNGVLLGFAKLRSLHLEGRVHQIDRCFFQPVQANLMRLVMRAQLIISGQENIFGISFMSLLQALDLSENLIVGSLSRNFFSALPKLKYLILSGSQISSIDSNAFEDVATSLMMLDLSNNRLKTLDVRSIKSILAVGMAQIYLLGNDWLCECHLKPLISLYIKHANSFGDIPYCKSPLHLYGTLFPMVKFEETCKGPLLLDKELISSSNQLYKTEPLRISSSSSTDTTTSVSNKDFSFKMACVSPRDVPESDEYLSNSDPVEYFLFAPPCHDFELILLENNSVQVIIEYPNEPINIIWFSEAMENFVYTVNDITVDYNCEIYSDPFLLAENLEENHTYTFCLVPSNIMSITPFNCLPLHVPLKTKLKPNIWISKDQKQLTLGLICVFLLFSLLFGGVIAYFGIKAYPSLLEGSNQVLVVKKSNKAACYVSTITECEYLTHKNSMKKKTSLAVKSAFQSVSLCNGGDVCDGIDENYLQEDYYEMPCIYNKTHNCQQKCLSNNKCIVSPSSPPPLPKRNSDSTLYGSASELISNVPFPKLSV